MIKRRWFKSLALLLGLFAAGWSGAALAKDLDIAAFFGRWQGTGISKSDLSIYFALTARDLDVLIKPQGDGFTLAWTTVQRQKGDPSRPTVEKKTTTLTFVPAGKPGVWREAGARDPMQAPYAWARIRGDTLIVNSLVIAADGSYEFQVYRRQLTDRGMLLEFSSSREGERLRQAKGQLVKIAND